MGVARAFIVIKKQNNTCKKYKHMWTLKEELLNKASISVFFEHKMFLVAS